VGDADEGDALEKFLGFVWVVVGGSGDEDITKPSLQMGKKNNGVVSE